MKYNPDLHHRRSIRLRGYDYTNAGAYFVTICLNRRIPKIGHIARGGLGGFGQWGQWGQPRWVAPTGTELEYDFPTFGWVENGVMVLNDSGKMVQQIWGEMPKYYLGIELGEFIVMPDHIHGIIKINNPSTINHANRPTNGNNNPISLPYLIDRFKTGTTNKYIDGVKTSHWKPFCKKLWQRNYWESIIRNETEYAKIAEYIRNNPILWEKGR